MGAESHRHMCSALILPSISAAISRSLRIDDFQLNLNDFIARLCLRRFSLRCLELAGGVIDVPQLVILLPRILDALPALCCLKVPDISAHRPPAEYRGKAVTLAHQGLAELNLGGKCPHRCCAFVLKLPSLRTLRIHLVFLESMVCSPDALHCLATLQLPSLAITDEMIFECLSPSPGDRQLLQRALQGIHPAVRPGPSPQSTSKISIPCGRAPKRAVASVKVMSMVAGGQR